MLFRSLEKTGRKRDDFSISHLLLTATGRTQEEMDVAVKGTRDQIAFYASTPSYRSVLELHGWGALGEELTALSKSAREDKWAVMGSLIDDDVLNAFAVVAEPDRLAAEIRRRFDGVVERVSFYTAYQIDGSVWEPVTRELHAA